MLIYSIKVHHDAETDIERLWDTEPDAAALVVALLEEAENDQELLESLTIKDFGIHGTEKIHVDKWVELHKAGKNVWRVKIWELEDLGLQYRIIYALDPRTTRYHVLAVLHRDFNYDTNDARSKRLIAAYDELGIPSYR